MNDESQGFLGKAEKALTAADVLWREGYPADAASKSYYAMFYTRPVGRYVIQVCRTLSCALAGAERVSEAISRRLGVKPGETDPTGTFTLVEVECLGACDRGPVVMVNDAWHELQSPDTAARLVDELREKGEAVLSGCHWARPGESMVESDPRSETSAS